MGPLPQMDRRDPQPVIHPTNTRHYPTAPDKRRACRVLSGEVPDKSFPVQNGVFVPFSPLCRVCRVGTPHLLPIVPPANPARRGIPGVAG